jgi:hypothetical protein
VKFYKKRLQIDSFLLNYLGLFHSFSTAFPQLFDSFSTAFPQLSHSFSPGRGNGKGNVQIRQFRQKCPNPPLIVKNEANA